MNSTVELINNIIYLGACYGRIWEVDTLNNQIVFVNGEHDTVIASFDADETLVDEITIDGWEAVKQRYLTAETSPENIIHRD